MIGGGIKAGVFFLDGPDVSSIGTWYVSFKSDIVLQAVEFAEILLVLSPKITLSSSSEAEADELY
jgi:hypothetical protein